MTWPPRRSRTRTTPPRRRPRLALEALETRLTPTAPTLADPAQVRVTEYDVRTGARRTLTPAETVQALNDLRAIDAQVLSRGYAGVAGLVAALDAPPGGSGPSPTSVFGPDGRTRVTPT